MQWDATANAGFTTGTPWLKAGKSYPQINVEGKNGKKFSHSIRNSFNYVSSYQLLLKVTTKQLIRLPASLRLLSVNWMDRSCWY